MINLKTATLEKLPATSGDLATLRPEFRKKVEAALAACADRGVELRPTSSGAYRSPADQARFWRQSRTTAEILERIEELRGHGRPVTAWFLEVVGPQYGKVGHHVTHALPGESWHQWGLALDVVWIVDGRACWLSPDDFENYMESGFWVWRKMAEHAGLDWGPIWDWAHVQAGDGLPFGFSDERREYALAALLNGREPWGLSFAGTGEDFWRGGDVENEDDLLFDIAW